MPYKRDNDGKPIADADNSPYLNMNLLDMQHATCHINWTKQYRVDIVKFGNVLCKATTSRNQSIVKMQEKMKKNCKMKCKPSFLRHKQYVYERARTEAKKLKREHKLAKSSNK